MTAKVKSWVSKQKIRYQQDGFDLDLSYICENVIAMGFPGEKIEGFYRNNIDEVHKFLEAKHHGKYRIYNLCSERSYDPQKFKGTVVNYPFKDHNPPSLCVIPEFCIDVESWLKTDGNVAVVHCKAGKGRTGVMICCYLLHSKQVSSARAALELYAEKRTHDLKGVTIPSQQRYVQYYEHILRSPDLELPLVVSRRVLLHEFTLDGTLNITGSSATIYINITQAGPDDGCYSYSSGHGGIVWKTGDPLTITLEEPLRLVGDIKVEVYIKHLIKQRLCHFWFNTYFIDMDENNSQSSVSRSNNNRTKVRFAKQDGSSRVERSSSDNVRDLERTISCPPQHQASLLQRPQLPGEWIRFTDGFDDELEKSPSPTIYLSFSRSQLDKINKKLFTNSSTFRITLGFSQAESGGNGGGALNSPRCFRSNSDSNQSSGPSRYSSSSSSSSCTDDEVSSEGSIDSAGVGGGGGHARAGCTGTVTGGVGLNVVTKHNYKV